MIKNCEKDKSPESLWSDLPDVRSRSIRNVGMRERLILVRVRIERVVMRD